MKNENFQQCFRNTVCRSISEVGNDAKLIRLFITNMEIANCDGYANMMLVNIKRYYGLLHKLHSMAKESFNTRRCLVFAYAMIIHRF